MFASLKNKIREETGSDLTKITSSWRSGAFLAKTPVKDEQASTSSSGGFGDKSYDSISPKLETYLEERLSEADIRERLRERDEFWQNEMERLRSSLIAAQGEEAASAQAVARATAAEAATALRERDAALQQLVELREAAAVARLAQDRLDQLTEELELARRDRIREQSEHRATLGESEAKLREVTEQLQLIKASLPPTHEMHQFDERSENTEDDANLCSQESGARCRRERSVLRRQLQETRLALADIKTAWSGHIASLETQVARVSRQAGEEGAERRRVEQDNRSLRLELAEAQAQLDKLKLALANSDAKERVSEVESRLNEVCCENEELRGECEAARACATEAHATCRAQEERIAALSALLEEIQHECERLQREYDKEKSEKDEALLRNAHMSQTLQLKQSEVRASEDEASESRVKIGQLEQLIAEHRENQATCMIIQERESSHLEQIQVLENKVKELCNNEDRLKTDVEELTQQLAEKNKKVKTLERSLSDMKKTLARELASGKCEPSSAEEADISRRYLKHVVLRFLTAREEARQLTRALSVLLRLSAQEEAELRAALPARTPLASWFAGLSPT